MPIRLLACLGPVTVGSVMSVVEVEVIGMTLVNVQLCLTVTRMVPLRLVS